MFDLERFAELERRHDARLGGEQSRPYRELLAFAAGALIMKHGAEGGAVVDYLRELLENYRFTIDAKGGSA